LHSSILVPARRLSQGLAMSTQFRHILVPLDFTEKNQAAVEVAVDLAQLHQARVTLIHVIERIEYAEDDSLDEFYESLRRKAKEKLSSFAKAFHGAGIAVAEEITIGNRGHDVVEFAANQEVDLVVLSSHQVDPDDGPRGWATLSYQVAILCPCPVLLVK
jgi:nucleotide-binding universal stress UspA family protein